MGLGVIVATGEQVPRQLLHLGQLESNVLAVAAHGQVNPKPDDLMPAQAFVLTQRQQFSHLTTGMQQIHWHISALDQ
jgi:hypothetical protein